MAAAKYNLLCEQGATFNPTITWTDEADLPVSLVSYTARMQVRSTIDAATVIIELTTENGRITLGGLAGTIELLLTCEETAALDSGTFKYDLELEGPGGVCTRLLKGNFKVDPEVTR